MSSALLRSTRHRRRRRVVPAILTVAALTELILIRLGQTYGSTEVEQALPLPGDGIIPRPSVVTNHAVTIDAPPARVWPWLTQMGWHRAGWYTARWVDQVLFPANWPSATQLIPELQDIEVGSFIPDGAPETKCGFIVEELDPDRTLVLHSTSHLPATWQQKGWARLDWTWTFTLTPVGDGRRTRFHFRSRWITDPWWFTLFGWLVVVPADFIMSRSMLNGVRDRAEA
ncbi:MAG TPA: hypothetical protein VLJ88_08800 [Propionibacteriaceae bacterium]|nr:hypothetical protein [Propionibacteriaceae bacterium]